MKIASRFAVAALAASTLLAGCAYMAVQSAPAKVASTERSASAIKADKLFWETLHSGNYEGIGAALEAVTGAYLGDQSDAITAAHVGFLHVWRLAERARNERMTATMTDDEILARRYFQEAVALDPSDARYLGFLGTLVLAEGSIHKDEKLTRQGYYMLKDSIKAWPEFNLFTAGYAMSAQPADSEQFKEGLEWQWKNMGACVDKSVARNNPDFSSFMQQATLHGEKRVCWNSWIAPHNFEGFFMNMGDMLVKSGDWETARKIYANAKLSPTYGEWKFAPVLQARIDEAQANVAVFNESVGQGPKGGAVMMFNSAYSCMACHQQ